MTGPALDLARVDLSGLRGFRFACRPDCGLCCYTSPALRPAERERLVQLDPTLNREEDRLLSLELGQRGEGGSCRLLVDDRCRLHEGRPHPCRTFPVEVHLGPRPQATLVLSCPGLRLDPLGGLGPAGSPGEGFESELDELTQAWSDPGRPSREARARKEVERWFTKAARRPGWEADPWLSLGTEVDEVARAPALPADDLPEETDGLDLLPIFWDGPHRIAALAAGADGPEVLRLNPAGGIVDRFGPFAIEEDPLRATDEGARWLAGYLRYALARERYRDGLVMEWVRDRIDTAFVEFALADLHALAATVLARARLRGLREGRPSGVLDTDQVLDGIRATDADLLDRPSPGELL
jgi:Fe-S-cluster containining protein